MNRNLMLFSVLALVLLAGSASAQSVIFTEYGNGWQKICYSGGKCAYSNHETYLRWDNQWIPVEWLNISNGNWSYTVQDLPTKINFTADGKTITIPKTNTSFNLQLFKISPSLTYSKAKLIANMVNVPSNITFDGVTYPANSLAYLTFPYSLSQVKDFADENGIRLGRWRFHAGKEHIDIYDDVKVNHTFVNETGQNETYLAVSTLDKSFYAFKIVNDEIRIYFVKSEANKLSGNITFQLNSWTVGEGGNAWTGNSSFDNTHENYTGTIELGNKYLHTEDSYVRDGTYANTNFGTEPDLYVKNGSAGFSRHIFIKVNITQYNIVKANWYGNNAYSDSFNVTMCNVSNNWNETIITWNNAPGIDASCVNFLVIPNNWLKTPNLTWVITGNNSFGIYDSISLNNKLADFLSREAIFSNLTPSYLVAYSGWTGNLTTWYNAGTGNEIYQIDVNATTPTNTNYTVWYADNGTGSWSQLGGALTGNNSLTISGARYQNTDVMVRLAGNTTATPEIISITFWAQALPGNYECPYTRCVNSTGWWNASGTFNASAIPITAAIGKSSSFDTIYVYGGAYSENPTISLNNLTLHGENSNAVTLTGLITVNSGADYVNISGFNITGTDNGIEINSNYVNISNNNFYAYREYYGAIELNGNNGIFSSNTITGADIGIDIGYSSGGNYNYFYNNTIIGSIADGISVIGSNNIFINNTITDSIASLGAGASFGDIYYGVSGGTDNLFTGGSIESYGTFHACYDDNFCNNTFVNTNFSTGANRTIIYGKGLWSYACKGISTSENGIIIHSYTSTNGGRSESEKWSNYREILNLSQNNVSFIETPKSLSDGLFEWLYEIGGLYPSSNYSVYRNDIFYSTLTTDSNGALPAFGSGGTTTTKISVLLALPPILPNITAWYNDINGWNQTAMSLNAGNSAMFNVTVDQNATNVSWKVAGSEEQNTSSLQFTRLFSTIGNYNVTAQAFNENGSSNIVYTVISVVSGGGGGTDWDYAYGWVKYANGTPISGATVTTSEGSDNSDVNGYFDFGYVFEHGLPYWFNTTKSGFYENDILVDFSSGDYQIVNVTLTPIPPMQNVWNVSGYVFNSTGGLIEGSLIGYNGGSNTSDANGYWYISGVSNGTHVFTASMVGYTPATISITMNGTDLENQNFTLSESDRNYDIFLKENNILYKLNNASIIYKVFLVKPITAVVVANETVFVTAQNILYRINRDSGQIQSKAVFKDNIYIYSEKDNNVTKVIIQ